MKMKAFKTIRARLTLSFIIIFGVTLIIFSFVLYNIFAGQSRTDHDFVMIALASSISETIRENGVNDDILSEIRDINKPGPSMYSGYIEVINSTENAVIRSPQLKEADVPLSKEMLVSALSGMREFGSVNSSGPEELWDSDGARILYYPAVHRQHKYAIVLISPLSPVEKILSNLRLILFITIPITLLLAGAGGWLLSRKAYAPVDELVNKANTITAERLHQRLAVSDADDEISHLAETLNSMMERLEESFSTLKQFTSDASHELRTPLTILRGEIEVALKKPRDNDEYTGILKGSLEEVKRLQNIVESLLMLSQYENKKLVIRADKINLNELLIDAVSKSRFIASKKNIIIILKLDEDNHDGLFIRGDYQKLLNVFLNLLDNAVKYSNENSVINCHTGPGSAGTDATVSIQDEGIGISEESLKSIFKRFYRADESRTRGESYSLGLGLSIIKAVIYSHGGRIEVSSRENEGSTFTVFIPLFRN